ncbi:MAG: TonB-dependent receptor [Muribaculaceae bacterium]|nr:TonB-dependent receptor [Muribaculaceae bacterium]
MRTLRFLTIILFLSVATATYAQKVTIKAVDRPAPEVFREIVEQTGKNFVYSSELLSGLTFTVDARKKPLKKVLDEMFRDTDIEYRIKGKNVVLRRKAKSAKKTAAPGLDPTIYVYNAPDPEATVLEELVVVSRLEAPAVETAEMGAKKITADEVRSTPALFGESDVIKALQMQPGVSEGTEGLAGMHVHGGNADENLCMLDNVPLYQVNHFAGLFSAFNTDVIRYIDFFKTSVPAKYDGRLSSFMDVRLLNGRTDGHHGTARLGLTSGAFNISGPIGSRTSYLFGLRRSWFDVLTIPVMAIVNSGTDEKTRFHYYFMDLNAKINHRFSNKANGFVSAYFGDDALRTGSRDSENITVGWSEDLKYDFRWGNLVVQTGLNYRFSSDLTAEFTAAYTRYFSSTNHDDAITDRLPESTTSTRAIVRTDNNINDWIFRADFDRTFEHSRMRFGANYVRHTFLPGHTKRDYTFNDFHIATADSSLTYGANEANVYIEDDVKFGERLRANAGLHASLFNIDRKVRYGLSPRLSMNYRASEPLALKAAYTRTVQYVHQLTETYLALPTDQWIPITGDFKPQTADKIAVGAYWQTTGAQWGASAEAYYKWMHNIIDYCDEYYLRPPMDFWSSRLTSGRGTAKGIDFKLEKLSGKFTGHISYSLAWADRTFKDKNGGRTYPARNDNRHTINILANWNVSHKVSLSASWTGHSGNRFTLMPQMWQDPGFGIQDWEDEAPLRVDVNNYQLPFYHRLDLACTVRNKHGYWSFGIYNAYCHMNTIAIRRDYREKIEYSPDGVSIEVRPVFQKVKLLPLIPSISYTWQF